MALRDISLFDRHWRYSGHRDALAARRLGRLWTHCSHKNRTGGDLEVAAGSMPPLAGEEVGQGQDTRPADVKALKSVLMNPWLLGCHFGSGNAIRDLLKRDIPGIVWSTMVGLHIDAEWREATITTRTGLSSPIQSSRHSGNSVV
jgi:hypothetical protein